MSIRDIISRRQDPIEPKCLAEWSCAVTDLDGVEVCTRIIGTDSGAEIHLLEIRNYTEDMVRIGSTSLVMDPGDLHYTEILENYSMAEGRTWVSERTYGESKSLLRHASLNVTFDPPHAQNGIVNFEYKARRPSLYDRICADDFQLYWPRPS